MVELCHFKPHLQFNYHNTNSLHDCRNQETFYFWVVSVQRMKFYTPLLFWLVLWYGHRCVYGFWLLWLNKQMHTNKMMPSGFVVSLWIHITNFHCSSALADIISVASTTYTWYNRNHYIYTDCVLYKCWEHRQGFHISFLFFAFNFSSSVK